MRGKENRGWTGKAERRGKERGNLFLSFPFLFFERKVQKTVKERKQQNIKAKETGKERRGQKREKKLKVASK